jgi:hypothetical protein
LMASERPTNLNDLEMEQYELAIEEQSYPFEDKAINVHKKNMELLYAGVYSSWIDKSISKLADLFPAVYARTEERTGFINTIDSFRYVLKPPLVDETNATLKAVTEVEVKSPGIDLSQDNAVAVPAGEENVPPAAEGVVAVDITETGTTASTEITAPVEVNSVSSPASAPDSDVSGGSGVIKGEPESKSQELPNGN